MTEILSVIQPGARVAAYEQRLAETLGVEHVVAVSSGTAALQTALGALDIGPGHEVLVPALTVVMSVAPILHVGATPVFVDCDPDGGDVDYDDLAAKVTDRTSAIMPVRLWGRAGDPARLARFAADRGLAVVDDCCQALGTLVDGAQVGRGSTLACYSTHRAKIITTGGEGGFITTNDPYLAARCRSYRSHGQTPPPGEAPLSRLGHNFRLAEPLADLGRGELDRYPYLLDRRIALTTLLGDLVEGTPGLRVWRPGEGHRWNGYCPLLYLQDLDRPRELAAHLARAGVPNSTGSFGLIPADTRPMFTPDTPGRCERTATALDGILAVVVTRDDDERTVHGYAETITREVTRWASA